VISGCFFFTRKRKKQNLPRRDTSTSAAAPLPKQPINLLHGTPPRPHHHPDLVELAPHVLDLPLAVVRSLFRRDVDEVPGADVEEDAVGSRQGPRDVHGGGQGDHDGRACGGVCVCVCVLCFVFCVLRRESVVREEVERSRGLASKTDGKERESMGNHQREHPSSPSARAVAAAAAFWASSSSLTQHTSPLHNLDRNETRSQDPQSKKSASHLSSARRAARSPARCRQTARPPAAAPSRAGPGCATPARAGLAGRRARAAEGCRCRGGAR